MMNKAEKIIISLVVLGLFSFFFVFPVSAQEIIPEELEVKTPKILPPSGTYFFKDLWRQLKLTFTFLPLKKAELRLKFANEKLIEVRELAKTENTEMVEKSLNRYQNELEKLKKTVEKLSEQEREKFLEKYVNHSLKQQMVLENIASQVKGEVYEKILAHRERHLERFKGVMEKVENKEMVKERIRQSVLDVFYVSPPRALKILESVEEMKENLSEELKEKIEEIKMEMVEKTKETFQVFPARIQAEKIKEQLRTFANPLMAQRIIEEIKEEGVIALTEEVKALPREILQEKLIPLSEEKRIEVVEKMVNQRIQHLEKLQEIKEKLKILPESAVASEAVEKAIEKQLEKLEKRIEKIESLPESAQEKLKEELKGSPKIKEEIIKKVPKLLEIKELELKEIKLPLKPPTIKMPREKIGFFCGWSTEAVCQTDDDCLPAGCSNQVCQGKNEESIITSCEWRDCYDAEVYKVKCGCFNGKCQWGK